ncbi:MAG: hypothetical protein VB106_11165 [Clostridiaceae bacterium]|nr:hypothetical protein [Clostridiaceae bacterium]
MNKTKLKEAEERFLLRYPGGFSDPMMLEIAKKHRVEKMNRMAQESFAAENFDDPDRITDSMSRIVSQSSIVSVFEKPRFREFIKVISHSERELLAHGLREFMHGDQASGFKLMAGLLDEYKLAKWTLLTVCPVYYKPDEEVFIKPTTVKGVIEYFELEGLKYSPKPAYEFYRAYREQINRIKKEVDALLQTDNTAFCGFLMMSLEDLRIQ